MNYRTMVKGALAFSLSLIVGSSWAEQTTYSDAQKYGATFESTPNTTVGQLNDFAYTEGDGITNAKYRVTQDVEQPYGWFSGSEEDESKIIAANGGQALQLNTDASTLTNKFDATKAEEINDAITTTSSAFFETDVKFVASDTPDAGIEGGQDATKFAIYAYCNEEAETVTTNLVVYHGVMGDLGITYTNEVFEDVTIDTEAYTKLRIEMKKLTDPNDPLQTQYNVFSVKVGSGEPISSDTAFDALIEEKAAGIWFLTTENTESDTDMEVASLNFKGTGEIDNISVGVVQKTTTYAIDWSASEGVVVSNLTAGVELAAGDTNFVAGVRLGFYPTVGAIQSVTVDGAAETVADPYLYTVGEADAIVTVVAAQVLDDNWTIEGLNPRGEWTDPTAVAADSKTLFYSNLVVNIDAADSTIGRTIDAAWIGARIVAPEAVTSANASQWTIGIGNATYTFDQIKESEGNFFNLWVPVTAAKVRTAIATQSDIVYTVEAYTDPSDKQILSMVINPMNIEITNTSDVEGAETIEVNDWEENVPAVPTVITIALVNGATYTDAAGVLTFAAPEGYVVNSIYTNGVNTGSTTTFTTNGLTGTINIVAAAKKVRTAIGHKWFENPTIVGSLHHDIKTSSGYAPWHLGGDGDYVAGTSWTAYHEMKAFDINDIIASSGSAVVSNFHDDTAGTWGAAVSMALNVALVGSDTGNNVAIAYPLNTYNGTIGEDSFLIENDIGIGFNDAAFTSDGQYLYTDCYKTSGDHNRNYIYKFRVLNGLKSSGVNLQFVEKYNMGERVRSMALGQFQSGDVVYALLNNNKVVCFNTADANATATELLSGYAAAGYFGDIIISGTATATPHIVISGANATEASSSHVQHRLDVYTLTATGTAIASSDPVLSLDDTGLAGIGFTHNKAYCNSGFVTEDEETFIFEWGDSTFYAIQYVEPQYTATYTGSENVIVTNTYDGSSYEWGEGEAVVPTQIACLTGTVLSFYPTEGNVITNVTIGGVAQTGFDPACYSITVISDTNLVVLAGASAAEFKAGDTYGTVTLSAAQAEWLNGFDNYDAIDAALKTDSSNLEKRYLLNVNPLTGSGDLTITAITVGTDVKVTVELDRTNGNGAIKGTLKLYGTADLATDFAALGSVTFDDATFATKDTATATFTGSGAKFFKAVIE